MAFIDIKDPSKRKEIVQDYIANLKDFKEKTENDKAKGLDKGNQDGVSRTKKCKR